MNPQNQTPENGQVKNTSLIDLITATISNPNQLLSKEELIKVGISEHTANALIAIKNSVQAHYLSQNSEHQRQQILLSHAQHEAHEKQLEFQTSSSEDTFETISRVKKGLNNSIQSSQKIQFSSAAMYVSTFILGFILVGAGLYLTGVEGKNDWFTAAFGASGFVLILTTFIANPPRELQKVRSNYVQLSMLALGWLNELVDNSGRRQMDTDLKAYTSLVELQNNTTQQYLRMLEDYAEPAQTKDPVDIQETLRALKQIAEKKPTPTTAS